MALKKKVLLRELRCNARHPISVISRREGIPVTTLYAVLKGLESGVVKKYVSLLGDRFEKEILLVEATDNNYVLRSFLGSSHAVNNLYRTNKGFIAEVFLDDRKEVSRIRRFLKNNKITFSFHELKETLFQERFVPE